ncbi:MAG: hypothetical protein NTY38_02895, partial [Acidobacteria bacterium]|nr:hypothetical protein [Acidobacteriota bacterium]
EEDPDQLLGRLSYAGFTQTSDTPPWRTLKRSDDEQFSIMVSNYLNAEDGRSVVDRLNSGKQGALLVVTIPNRRSFLGDQSKLAANLDRLLREASASGLYSCCVFDSIDALVQTESRRLYERIFGLTKRARTIGIFLSELHARAAECSLRDHLADVVIRLDTRQRVEPFVERILEIEKCRTQSQIRGQHMFSIHSRHGFTVYPSVQSLLGIWRRRVKPKATQAEVESWSLPPDLDFDRVLQGDIVKGSTVLLTGPPATHKLAIGLSFLSSGLESRPDSQALLVSLREDEPAIERIIRTYPQFHALVNGDEQAGLNPKLKVLHFPPDYFSAERFLHWMQRALREERETKGPVSRVLFSNLNQLLHNSPMFAKEELFVDALLELFRRNEITSLFIGVGGGLEKEVQYAFDTIIFTDREELPDGERVSLRVGHSGPCNADRSAREVVRTTRGGLGWLSLQNQIT